MKIRKTGELIKVCLLRGKLLALISFELNQGASETDFFLTGLLSSIDVIVNQDMETVPVFPLRFQAK